MSTVAGIKEGYKLFGSSYWELLRAVASVYPTLVHVYPPRTLLVGIIDTWGSKADRTHVRAKLAEFLRQTWCESDKSGGWHANFNDKLHEDNVSDSTGHPTIMNARTTHVPHDLFVCGDPCGVYVAGGEASGVPAAGRSACLSPRIACKCGHSHRPCWRSRSA